jgi:hypothetical protein
LASAFKNSGAPTDQETKNWRQTIQFNQTPSELHAGGSQEAMKLMLARAAATQQKWEKTMGVPLRSPIFTKHYADVIDKVMDSPGYTQKFMNERSSFGDDNTAVESKGSMTGESEKPITPTRTSTPSGTVPPPPPPRAGTTFKFPNGQTRLYDNERDAALIKAARAHPEIKEVNSDGSLK